VTIFDVGEHDGDPFIAMEFLAGETLAELIRDGARCRLAPPEAARNSATGSVRASGGPRPS
jgi:hypothetical protein